MTEYKKFTPISKVVVNKVEFLLNKGAVIVKDTPNALVLKRGEQIATVDQWGRVTWEQQLGTG